MINIGTQIGSYVITAIVNGVVMAESKTAPEPFAVWRMDCDGNGVNSGRYSAEREDAEWEFAHMAFPWFADNAPVNMIEDDEEENPPQHNVAEDIKKMLNTMSEYNKSQPDKSKLRMNYIEDEKIETISKVIHSSSDILLKYKSKLS